MPEPVQDVAQATLGSRLYVVSGYDALGHSINRVFVYENGAWRRGPNLPVALNHAGAAALGGRLYVTGGFTDDGQSVPTARTYVLSAAGDSWENGVPMTHPRAAMALVTVGDRLYALGGTDGKNKPAPIEVFSAAGGTWRDLAPLPQPRDHGAGFAYQGMACLAGGRTPNTARVDCYDPAAQTWKQLPDLPAPTSGAAAVALGDQVLVAGGEGLGAGAQMIDQLARLRDGSWRKDTMLLPRHDLQLTVLDNRAWACGGGTAVGLKATASCTSIT
jgi:N-acetylneuraminic acid mutarotase